MSSILYEYNFSQFTIIELLEQYWPVTYIYKNDPDSIYYFIVQITKNGVSSIYRRSG